MVKKRRDCGLPAVEAGARNRPAGTKGRRQALSVYEPNLCAWPGAIFAEGCVQSFGHLLIVSPGDRGLGGASFSVAKAG